MDNLRQSSQQQRVRAQAIRDTQLVEDDKGHHVGHVIQNVNLVPGQVNLALETDGMSGYVNLGNFINTCLGKPTLCHSGMTVSLWLKYKISNEKQYLLGTSGSHIGQPGFVVYHDPRANSSDHLAVSVRTGVKSWTLHVKIPQDTWTHLLFTWNSHEGLIVHTNGTLVGSLKEFIRTPTLDNHHTLLTLGRANDQYKLSSAAYDELSVWYHVLTEKEVKAIYARTSGTDFVDHHAKASQGKCSKHLVSKFTGAISVQLQFCAYQYDSDRTTDLLT